MKIDIMEYRIRNIDSINDWDGITKIINYFIEHDIAAYPDEKFENSFFSKMYNAAPDYPFLVVESGKDLVGFGYLHPFRSIKTMRKTATLTYFILPEFTGKGIGTLLLRKLIDGGKKMGICNFLAHISSHNEGSIRFHKKHGFEECGRFREVGSKFGKDFDMIWMQRIEA